MRQTNLLPNIKYVEKHIIYSSFYFLKYIRSHRISVLIFHKKTHYTLSEIKNKLFSC